MNRKHIPTDWRSSRTWLWGIFGLLVLWNLRTLLTTVNFFDDAFMFLRYAKLLDAHGSMGWNAGEKTYGLTSLPYGLFVAFLYQLFPAGWLADEKFLSLCSVIWGSIGLWAVYRAVKLALTDSLLAGKQIEVGTLIVLLSAATLRGNLFTGMDTMMAFAANGLLLWAGLHYGRTRNPAPLLLFALTAWFSFSVRPDNGLYALGFPVLFLWLQSGWKRPLWLFLLYWFGLVALDSGLRFAYFGQLLPLSFYAKSLGFYAGYLGISLWEIADYLRAIAFDMSPFLLLALAFFQPRNGRTIVPYVLPLVLTVAYYFTVVQIMGFDARYYVPSLPFLILACLVSLRECWQGASFPPLNWLAPVLLVPAVFLLTLLSGRYQQQMIREAERLSTSRFPLPVAYTQNPFPTLEWYPAQQAMSRIVAQLPRPLTIGASEYGMLGNQFPEVRIVCLVGLHNTPLARQGCSPENMNDLLRRDPMDLIWMPHTDYTQLHHSLLQAPVFAADYDFLPGALDYGVAIRRESPYYAAILCLLRVEYGLSREEWQEVGVSAERWERVECGGE